MTDFNRRTLVTMAGAAAVDAAVSATAAAAQSNAKGGAGAVRPGRVRHYVMAARKPEAVCDELYDFLQLKPRLERPRPPGAPEGGPTAAYGFSTRMMRVGTTMLEIVSPTREPHTLHTFFQENGGDGGYMVVMQTYDDKALLERAAQNGLKLAMEMPNFAGQHLMQFDYKVFGTRFEHYLYTPEDGWWGNPSDPEWTNPQAVDDIVGAAVAVEDPGKIADLAARTFAGTKKGNSVQFAIDRKIEFVAPVKGHRGLRTLYLTARDRKQAGRTRMIGGLEFTLV